MATPKQLDFSSPGGVDSYDISPPSPSSHSRRKSPRKPALKRAAPEAVAKEEIKNKKKKHKKKKLASPVTKRIWDEEDELAILKGLVDYRAKTGLQPKIDWNAFFNFIQSQINVKFSLEQLLSKISKLKRKFHGNLEQINQGKDPHFTRSSDSEAFGFSMMIWGNNEAEFPQHESGEEKSREDEEVVANDVHIHENGAVKSGFNGKSHDEVKITENGTAAKESHHDDQLCALRDAFETMMSNGLSDYQKKFQLEKLMNLRSGKRKELSNEWKALCIEEAKLNIKKLRFSAKLAEEAAK